MLLGQVDGRAERIQNEFVVEKISKLSSSPP